MEDIFESEGLGPLGEEAIEQEMSEAAQQFTAAGEEYDEGRLREQVTEVLKVGWPVTQRLTQSIYQIHSSGQQTTLITKMPKHPEGYTTMDP